MGTYITRNDEGLGVGSFDSIAWAFEKYGMEDNKEMNYGIMHGNEDSPMVICLWREKPSYMQEPDLVLE